MDYSLLRYNDPTTGLGRSQENYELNEAISDFDVLKCISDNQ